MIVQTKNGGRRPATDTERANFLEMALDEETALSTAIARLQAQQNLFADGPESSGIRVRLAELEAQLVFVRSEVLAAVAEESAVAPPTRAEVQQLKELVGKLDRLIAGPGRVGIIIDAAAAAAKLWHRRQPPPL